MNPLNYGSLEASQRLVDAGIVLETEKSWVKVNFVGAWKWSLFDTIDTIEHQEKPIPAPSIAEVWRELPGFINTENVGTKLLLSLQRAYFGENEASYEGIGKQHNTNPTDALIDLLIWVRKENHV